MFQRSGYFLGAPEDLMVGDPSNPTGYFENLKVWRANESVLAHFGATWFDPPDEDEQLARSGQLQPGLRCVLDELLAQAAVTQRPLALKDPRMGVLMPLWWPLLADLLHPVLVIRDPFEIALSLERRDATAVPVAL
ncbi:MAG TPA: hypothetical protein VMG62_04525, partial [Solirubrobacteraceae bacterium]|nr:hypothetical protein [Solirubrobacteraceae bacterium]